MAYTALTANKGEKGKKSAENIKFCSLEEGRGKGKTGYKIIMDFLLLQAFLKQFIVTVISSFNHSLTKTSQKFSNVMNIILFKELPSNPYNILIIISMNRLIQQKPISYGDQLQELCNAARRISESSSQLAQHFRYYINFYIQHQRLSQQFFNCLCQHNILQKLLTQQSKHLPTISILELFHLLVSNINKANDLVYVFSQPIVHEYLFQRFNIYKQTGETIEYYVQLLKTIIMKSANQGNQFLIKLFCNKRFPTFPIFTAVTILGVSEECDELVRITAQQCVLMLVNLINRHKTGLVYLNELQMIVFFFELTRQMLDEEKNTDKQGSIKYFIDLVYTLRQNKTSIFLVFNLLTNQLFFKHIKSPQKILRFIRQFRQHLCEHHQFQVQQAQDIISTLYRIFHKYYFAKFINFTYFCAQQILPGLAIKSQPKLLKFYAERCRKIDDYLVNQEDYYKSQKGNDCLIDQWMEFNNNAGNSPIKAVKKSSLSEFFSTSDSSVDKYIKDVMVMAGLEVQKLKIPIIKLTYSSNFKTSLFLVEQITSKVQQKKLHEDYCKDKDWAIEPTEQLLSEIYLVHLTCEKASAVSAILVHEMQGEVDFISKIKPELARIITYELCKETPNVSKQYLLLLFKLLSKLKLSIHLDPKRIQKLLERLFYLQKLIGQQLYDESRYPSYFKYVMKNQGKTFIKEKIDRDSLINGKYKLSKPKQPKLEHFLFYYEVIKLFLDPSLKNLNEFVEEYWQMNFKEKGKDKALLSYRDIKKGYIAVFPTDRFEFEVFLQNKEGGQARFLITDNDFLQKKVPSSALHFEQYKNQVRLQNIEAAQLFRKDIEAIRETRKDIFRRSLLQYMPFIYESIQVKYRNHRYQSSVRSSI